MVTLRQLRYLVALARTGHFARAAESCGISQPALSMQIKELEKELGGALFERGHGRLVLTDIGAETVRRAQDILLRVEDMVIAARRARAPMTGRLRLGVIPTIAPYLLPRVLPLLRESFAELWVELREGRTETILGELADGALDILLLSVPLDEPGVTTAPLFEDRFLLVAPANDPVIRQTRLRQQEIPQDRLLLLEEGHCLRNQALSVCGLDERAPQRPLGATSLATIVQMVSAGYGVTLLPETAAPVELRDDRIVVKRFTEPQPHRTIGLAWRQADPRESDFAQLVELFKELAP